MISYSAGGRPRVLGGSGTVPWAVVREVGVRGPPPKSPGPGGPGQGARTGVLVGVAYLVPGYFEGGNVTEVGDISSVYSVSDEVARYFAPGRSTGSKVPTGLPEGESPCMLIVYGTTPGDVRGEGGVTVFFLLGGAGTSDPGTRDDSLFSILTNLRTKEIGRWAPDGDTSVTPAWD